MVAATLAARLPGGLQRSVRLPAAQSLRTRSRSARCYPLRGRPALKRARKVRY